MREQGQMIQIGPGDAGIRPGDTGIGSGIAEIRPGNSRIGSDDTRIGLVDAGTWRVMVRRGSGWAGRKPNTTRKEFGGAESGLNLAGKGPGGLWFGPRAKGHL